MVDLAALGARHEFYFEVVRDLDSERDHGLFSFETRFLLCFGHYRPSCGGRSVG